MISALLLAVSGFHMIGASAPNGARATISYKLRSSPNPVEGDPGPTVSTGILRISVPGQRPMTIALSKLGLLNRWTAFFTNAGGGCGTGAPLWFKTVSNATQYLIVESVEVGKGCRPWANLVNTRSGQIVQERMLFHAHSHRLDILPQVFRAEGKLRVTDVQTFEIPASFPSAPWHVTVIRGSTPEGSRDIFVSNLGLSETPMRDEFLTMGRFGQSVGIQLNPSHERRWTVQQSPTPTNIVHNALYSRYLARSSRLALQGRLLAALDSYKTALTYRDYRRFHDSEALIIPKYQRLIDAVRSGKMTAHRAKQLWFRMSAFCEHDCL